MFVGRRWVSFRITSQLSPFDRLSLSSFWDWWNRCHPLMWDPHLHSEGSDSLTLPEGAGLGKPRWKAKGWSVGRAGCLLKASLQNHHCHSAQKTSAFDSYLYWPLYFLDSKANKTNSVLPHSKGSPEGESKAARTMRMGALLPCSSLCRAWERDAVQWVQRWEQLPAMGRESFLGPQAHSWHRRSVPTQYFKVKLTWNISFLCFHVCVNNYIFLFSGLSSLICWNIVSLLGRFYCPGEYTYF